MFHKPIRTKGRFFSINNRTIWEHPAADKSVMPSNICMLRNEKFGNEIFLIGTIHISERSANDVRALIRDVKPSAVMIELDQKRCLKLLRENDILHDQEEFAKELSLTLGHKNKAFGWEEMISGIIPGKEFLVAIQEAKRINAELVLGDRSAETTFGRVHFLELIKHVLGMIVKSNFSMPKLHPSGQPDFNEFDRANFQSPFSGLDLSDIHHLLEAVEKMNNRVDADKITGMMRSNFPQLAHTLIDERDAYMINSLRKINHKRIVAVVGLGHVSGMERHWNRLEDRCDELNLSEDDLNDPVRE